jgi:hypothetical protein
MPPGSPDELMYTVMVEGPCPCCGTMVKLKVPPPMPRNWASKERQQREALRHLQRQASPEGCYRTRSVAGKCSLCKKEILRVGKGYAHIDLNQIGEFPTCQECCPLCKLERNAASPTSTQAQTR